MNFKRPRVKNDRHLEFVRQLPCCVCLNPIQTEAAHIRMACMALGKRSTGKQEKPSDCWTVPLCHEHHAEQHTMSEADFWTAQGIDPFIIAMALYCVSGDFVSGESIIVSRGKHEHHTDAAVPA